MKTPLPHKTATEKGAMAANELFERTEVQNWG
jgi:hypothetical protein